MKKINWKKWFWTALVIYLIGGMALYFLQDAVLFHPVTLNRQYRYNFPQPHKDISIPVNQEDTISLVDFSSTDTVTRGVVLYFHGNKRNISWYAKYIPYFTRHGYQVLMIDYPGFGKSTGKLNEQKLYDWALQVYRLAIKRFAADSIIIYGKIKPTSSILTPVETITRTGEATEIVTKGRHDPCVGIRGAPVVEAMMALVLADQKLLHRAQCGG